MTEAIDLSAELLLSAYAAGIFPMGSDRDPDTLYWVDPPKRGVLPLDGLHISKSLRKRIKRGGFEVRINCDFAGTMRDCADRSETWINDAIVESYADLHRRGFAHSVETWVGDVRVGGLYGVSLGAGFFGESMFSKATDASKIALVWLVARLRVGGYRLLDTQFTTDHLESLGAIEIPRKLYKADLANALGISARFHDMSEDAPAETIIAAATAP
jgi:leucyl/phenylalanyl-tRNA--protein transferase